MITSCLPISIHEERRLKALRLYPIDFKITEVEFDEITMLASNLCDVPVAYISIVELDTQYFKSKIGFDIQQSPRTISFCHHTIMNDGIFEVPDTLLDPRFFNNPLVVKNPFVRYYAGVPLVDSSGYKLGSLCVVDYVPRSLTKEQGESLLTLSRIVMKLFELRKSRQELVEAKTKAEGATQAKADFLSNMSHEIRTPLNGVIGLTNVLMQDNPQPHQLELLETLKFSGENLMTIVNDILDFSQIEAGRIKLEQISFNMNELLESLARVNQPTADSKGLTLRFMKNLDKSNLVMGDPIRLTQILNNLVNNALKFTEHGGVTIEVNQEPGDGKTIDYNFSVNDTGVGISEEDKLKIFKRFSQVGNKQQKKSSGSGLGLVIVKKLLELQGSAIELVSAPGQGSSFNFKLSYQLIQQHPPTNTTNKSLYPLGPGTILLAEDNSVNALIAERIISKWGLEIDWARNGVEVLEKLKDRDYDLILMDIHMPEMDGFECTRNIRLIGGKYATIPILALSASVSVECEHSVFEHGLDDFILKPFKLENLHGKLQEHLGRRSNPGKTGP